METLEQNPVMNQEPAMVPAPQFQPDGARPMLGFWEAVKICWSKYADFTGRARRSEYWWFCLFTTIVILIPVLVMIIFLAIGSSASEGAGSMLWYAPALIAMLVIGVIGLALIIPSLAVQTRRLHDTGRSGWWVVWNIIMSVVASFAEVAAFGLSNYYEATPTPSDIDMFKAIMENSMGLFIVVALLYLINLGISIAVFVFSLLDSHREENKYGPSPKYQ